MSSYFTKRAVHALSSAFVFSLFLGLFLSLLRLGFIVYSGLYEGALAHPLPFDQIVQVLKDGFKYDNRVVAAFSLIFLILALVRTKAAHIFALFVLVLCLFLQVANITYYEIYGVAFDTNLLDAFNQSPKILMGMALHSEYHIPTKVLVWLVFSVLSGWLYYKLTQKTAQLSSVLQNLPFKPVCGLLVAFFSVWILYGINSRLALTGVSLDFTLKPAKDPFLRQVTPGAFRNLYLVFKDYKKSHNVRFSSFTPKSLLQASIDYFNLPPTTKLPLDLGKLLSHTSQNPAPPTIQHVFYIVSESLSSWHFDPRFDAINLTSALKSLNDQQHGFIFPFFLEDARRTVKSLDVQLTGLFDLNDTNFVNMGVNIPSLPTAIGNQMKGLGFDTTFYYGGSGIWNRLDRFSKKEGFDHFVFNTYLMDFANARFKADPNAYPRPIKNGWGVHDNVLFDYILNNTPPDKKTFSMVMTLSNHPTRNVNLKAFGVPVDQIKDFIAHAKDKNMPDATFLGHVYWYDKILVDFIKKARVKFPNALFVITGDHFDRSFTYAKDNTYWTKSVPLIVYAPSLRPKLTACIGSHIDIAPTIMELVAPKGYKYASFGKPLFSNATNGASASKDCAARKPFVWGQSNDFALGFESVAGQSQKSGLDFLYTDGGMLLYVKDHAWVKAPILEADIALAKELRDKKQIANGLSWYYLFHGGVIR
ncbi:Phosphatidylglycerol-membrane-oligosaccharide glycerophosphotransferase MdoB [Helicobacter sp. NHP19-003]|uniref:Phosphatidylglycerol-membrane-oligosaccharide glycerophosphotransferase MdoB n=1 Tax=Helicobacter gastrocanis TaxID=2849641 RepID=A0ABN6I3B2_9HELI|nr:LTA synthase family protein [Helicobacter sp. NHP19-003]BCZ18038.1 Phosphatidylglycerol-membrane-oligosaccharide glycerophosphotransferase MdoB [Helicobacter sp. NHP19-003]